MYMPFYVAQTQFGMPHMRTLGVKNTKEHLRKLGTKNTGGNRTLGEKHSHHPHGGRSDHHQTVHDTLRQVGGKAKRGVSDSIHQFANQGTSNDPTL
jgi:hypothetical protein